MCLTSTNVTNYYVEVKFGHQPSVDLQITSKNALEGVPIIFSTV